MGLRPLISYLFLCGHLLVSGAVGRAQGLETARQVAHGGAALAALPWVLLYFHLRRWAGQGQSARLWWCGKPARSKGLRRAGLVASFSAVRGSRKSFTCFANPSGVLTSEHSVTRTLISMPSPCRRNPFIFPQISSKDKSLPLGGVFNSFLKCQAKDKLLQWGWPLFFSKCEF